MATESSKRLFFALYPPEPVRTRLHRLQTSLLSRNGRHTQLLDLHLTLQFLGNVDEQQLECVTDAANTIRSPCISLQIDTLNFWSRSQIAWAGPKHCPDELQALVDILGAHLEPCGFEPAPASYVPHITLARKARRIDAREIDPIAWQVDNLVLFEAVPGHRPNRYRQLIKIKLENQ